MTAFDVIVRAAPFALSPFIALCSRRSPTWRPVLAQTIAFSIIVAAEPYTLAHPRVSVITLAMWPGVALAGAMAAMGEGTGTLRKGGWGRNHWLVSLACYAIVALACAALYTRALWWIGSAIEMGLRVAVGPALVWTWTARKSEGPRAVARSPWRAFVGGSAPVNPSADRNRYHAPRITPAQVAALAPAVEVALAPLGPWARWLAGHAAVVEDWPIGLAGSAVAYAVVALAMAVDVRRNCRGA